MASKITEGKAPRPPYISFSTFKTFTKKMHETVLPNRVDTSILPSFSNSVAKQVVTALKWLGLIEGDGTPQPELRALVEYYGTDKWADALRDVLQKAYSEILGGLDLSRASPRELDERLSRPGVGLSGDVLEKCKRFLIDGMVESGQEVSVHILNRSRRKGGEQKARKASAAPRQRVNKLQVSRPPAAAGSGEPARDEPPAETLRLPFPIRGKGTAILWLPNDFGAADLPALKTMLDAYFGTAGPK